MNYYITDYHHHEPDAVALEDSIMLKGGLTTAGSKILANFISPLDAAVVTRLLNKKIAIAGKTKMNEFGIGGVSAERPDNITGAVKAVADNAVSFSLCNDVFGIYRRQAAQNGICYIHPTYGTVSRFGLIPLASSMDQIGVVCKNLTDGFKLLSIIAGNDHRDGAMFPEKSYEYNKTEKKLKVGIPVSVAAKADETVQKSINSFAGKFQSKDIDLEYFDICKQVMFILSSAEISSNITRYDGVKFGYRSPKYKGVNDLYINTRTEALGLEAKLMSIMGAMALSRDYYLPYYDKAMKARSLIKKAIKFEEYDIIILPAAIPGSPYDNLPLYALAPLAGLPSVSFNYKGGAVQLIAGVRDENALLTAWEALRRDV